jgi:hypothetical protein
LYQAGPDCHFAPHKTYVKNLAEFLQMRDSGCLGWPASSDWSGLNQPRKRALGT